MHRIRSLILGFSIAVAATLTHAGTPSAAWTDMSQIQVQLTDLNADDGISPYLVARSGGEIVAGLQTDTFIPSIRSYGEYHLDVSYFPSLPVAAGIATLTDSPVSGTARREPDRLYTSVTGAPSLITESFAWWRTSADYTIGPDGDTLLTGRFDLSPHTALSLSVSYSLLVTVAEDVDGSAAAMAFMMGSVGTTTFQQATADYFQISVDSPGDQSASGLLGVTLLNDSDVAAAVYFEYSAMSVTSVTAVPEPGILSLMLAGLLPVVLCARERRRA